MKFFSSVKSQKSHNPIPAFFLFFSFFFGVAVYFRHNRVAVNKADISLPSAPAADSVNKSQRMLIMLGYHKFH